MSYILEDLFKYSEDELDQFLNENNLENFPTLSEKRFAVFKSLVENNLITNVFYNSIYIEELKQANTYEEYLDLILNNDHLTIKYVIDKYGIRFYCDFLLKNLYDKINFVNINLNIEDIKILCSAIEKDYNLISLRFDGCNIDDIKLKIIADSIKNLNITMSSFINNKIGNDGIKYLFNNLNNIEALNIENNIYNSNILKDIAKIIKNNDTLTLLLWNLLFNHNDDDDNIYYNFIKSKIKYNINYKSYLKLEMKNIELLPMYLRGKVVPGALQDYNKFLSKMRL